MSRKLVILTASALAAMCGPAFAHTGAGTADGFQHGFLHPLGGLDHVLAMIAVGLYAARRGGRSTWLVPVAFVSTMLAGGIVANGGIGLPMVEQTIGLSVVVMSAAVAFGLRIRAAAAMVLVGAFALFHGHAHGSEGADAVSFLPYAVGFVLATSLLHAVGVGLGLGLGWLTPRRAVILRAIAGATGMVAGVAILAG